MTAWDDLSRPAPTDDLVERGKRWSRTALLTGRGLAPQRPWLRMGEAVTGRYVRLARPFLGRRRDQRPGPAAWTGAAPVTPGRPPSTGSGPAFGSAEELGPASPRAAATESRPAGLLGPTYQRIDGTGRRSPSWAAQSSPSVLEPGTRALLTRILRFDVPNVRLYPNASLGGIGGRPAVDALAYPDRVLFAPGRYDPASSTGLGLLGHELTHVARLRGQVPTGAQPRHLGGAAEEEEALRNERTVLRHFGGPSAEAARPPAPLLELPTTTAQQPEQDHATAAAPRAAVSDRDLSVPTEPGPSSRAAPELSPAQLARLKDEVYRDLLARIRTEFERGG